MFSHQKFRPENKTYCFVQPTTGRAIVLSLEPMFQYLLFLCEKNCRPYFLLVIELSSLLRGKTERTFFPYSFSILHKRNKTE